MKAPGNNQQSFTDACPALSFHCLLKIWQVRRGVTEKQSLRRDEPWLRGTDCKERLYLCMGAVITCALVMSW